MTKTQLRDRMRAVLTAGALPILIVPMLSLVALPGKAGPQASSSGDADATQPYRISVDVGLVVLNPVVRDRSGSFASNLSEQDFEVYEDGVRQSIRLFRHEDLPVTVGLVVDHSASMGRKLPEVIESVRTFARSSNPADEMFVVNFNEKVTLGLPGPMRFTNRPGELEAAIDQAPVTGQTALYDAVIEAQTRLGAGTRDKKVLIVISDGGDNASRHSLAEALKVSEQSGTVVYTIGIFDAEDADRNPGVLRRFAQATGGEAFFPGQLAEVAGICEAIARDIRNQYTVGYISGNAAKPGTWRSIRVVAGATGHGKLRVRARTGYLAGDTEAKTAAK